MGILDRITTKHTFADGTKASLVHRFAMRLEIRGRVVDIGFEPALEPGVERLIHEGAVRSWKTPQGDAPVTPMERAEILAKVVEYCKLKGITYRVAP